jgi:hypothetical protein
MRTAYAARVDRNGTFTSTTEGDGVPRVIAFYLPQFHPIPENDAWWGHGFTEWTNSIRTAPRFPGHYQPHLPADLGFYDLRVPEARVAQAELARRYGIGGFCYYHYWFNGRRLLGLPFSEVLATGSPDFPFCLCWANESWTRNWDGGDREVLVAQEYDEEDDLAHIRWLIEAFRDHRYIRVGGRPLLPIYRAQDLPDAPATIDLWRKECSDQGVPEPLFVKFDTHGDASDPALWGCDAAAEFLPHGVPDAVRPSIPAGCHPGNGVFAYEEVAEAYAHRPAPPWVRYSCVLPGWDNSPRQPDGQAFTLHGSDPATYERWLTRSLERAAADGREVVFVNAWNEWAEGAHLEPDQRFGRRYLEATRSAVLAAGHRIEDRPLGGGHVPAIEERHHDLHERFVRLQRQHTDVYGSIRRDADRELAAMAAALEEARRDAATLAARTRHLEQMLDDGRSRGRYRPHLTWRDDTTLDVEGVEFRLMTGIGDLHASRSKADSFVLGKTRMMVENLIDMAPADVQTILELGIFKGGSAVLLEKLFRPERLLCVDLNPAPCEPLDRYIEMRGLSGTILPFYGTAQDDRAAVGDILDRFVPRAGLDIVIDDCSHLYPESKRSFELVLPRIAPGGLYVLEDWGWAHWPDEQWQGDHSPFEGQLPLSNLVVEIVLLAASRPELIDHVVVYENIVFVRRGPEPLPHDGFDLSAAYLTAGRTFTPIR